MNFGPQFIERATLWLENQIRIITHILIGQIEHALSVHQSFDNVLTYMMCITPVRRRQRVKVIIACKSLNTVSWAFRHLFENQRHGIDHRHQDMTVAAAAEFQRHRTLRRLCHTMSSWVRLPNPKRHPNRLWLLLGVSYNNYQGRSADVRWWRGWRRIKHYCWLIFRKGHGVDI